MTPCMALEEHRLACTRLRHAQFSAFTLSFADRDVEEDYAGYFWGRCKDRWRAFVGVAGAGVVAWQVALLLGKGGDGIVETVTVKDWVVLVVAVVLPMLAIGFASTWALARWMAKWVHVFGLIFCLLIGPIVTCARYASMPTSSEALGVVTAPLYIVSLVSSVFFLRLRFTHACVAASISGLTWSLLFGISLTSGPAMTGAYALSTSALLLACTVTVTMAYDLERLCRTQYLSDSRFLSIARNLQTQLEGLERSLLAASGKGDVTPADLDSPLEKAMGAVRSLLMDKGLAREHRGVLDVVMACLASPNLLAPDLEGRLRRGGVEVDVEVEKWLFNEVARRKRLSGDPDGVGQVQLHSADCEDETAACDVCEASPPVGVHQRSPDLPPAGSTETLVDENVSQPIGAAAEGPACSSLIHQRRRSSSAGSSSPATLPTQLFPVEDVSKLLRTPATIPLLARIDDFDFPIFDFAIECAGRPLLVMAHHLFVESGLVGRLGLDVSKFLNCMATVESGYHADLAFHNSLHAADVLHCMHHFMTLNPLPTLFTDLERLTALLAAAVHDIDHPGYSNNFLIQTSDRRAVLYNDRSVLENHHAATAFEVLSRKECSFLATLDRSEYRAVRDGVVEMVLATDLAQHFQVLTNFRKKVLVGPGAKGGFDPRNVREDRTLLMQMMMKCSDVSNPTKPWSLYSEWIRRITLEWFRQGDVERRLLLPISPFCDRLGPTMHNPAPSQSSFISFIVLPLYDALGSYVDLGHVRDGLERNQSRWKGELKGENGAGAMAEG
ncbi:hypothetical protein HK101_008336, partial [Irineochytrium annulatum]